MWKDFFYFTKSEQRGVLVLIVLIAIVLAIPPLFRSCGNNGMPTPNEVETYQRDYNAFTSSLRTTNQGQTDADFVTKRTELFYFDPNTADSLTFVNLGLKPVVIRNILRYRAKKGKFLTATDFRKIYGLTETEYNRVKPYIRIKH